MNTITAVEQITAAAEGAGNAAREIETMKIGQAVRQGDIYLHRVPTNHAKGKAVGPKLALGSQQNARHIAESPALCYAGTTLPTGCTAGTFMGPVVVSDAPFCVSHPEHATVKLPAGTYQVTHQMDAWTLDRVRD